MRIRRPAQRPPQVQGANLLTGVYECRASYVGPMVGLQFGIADASHYTEYDQKGNGTYTWNPATQTITFTSGSMKGLWRKWEGGTFRIYENGKLTSGDCPLNSAKDPHKFHW